MEGSEVVQLYISAKTDGAFRPIRELRGFEKIHLNPGESKDVSITLDDRSFAIWSDGWIIPGGEYVIEIGSSSRDIRLFETVEIEGVPAPSKVSVDSWYHTLIGTPSREEWEGLMGHSVPSSKEPKKGEFTLDNSCLEMKKHSFIMKIQYKITENIIAKGFGGKKDLSDPSYKMMLLSATDSPMRAVVISSSGAMSDSLALGMVHMANGKFLKGIAAMMKKG